MADELTIKEVPIEDVTPNKWNPNEMSDEMQAGLRKTLKSHGMYGGILVRKVKDKYEIIDGEHRWKAQKKAGAKTIPVIELNLDEADAIFRMLNSNKIRGSISSLKTAGIISTLLDDTPKVEVLEKIALSGEEVDGLVEALNESKKAPEEEVNPPKEEMKSSQSFSIEVDEEEYETIAFALEMAEGRKTSDKLIYICDQVIEDRKKKPRSKGGRTVKEE